MRERAGSRFFSCIVPDGRMAETRKAPPVPEGFARHGRGIGALARLGHAEVPLSRLPSLPALLRQAMHSRVEATAS
jgi:hypothetical protein